MKRLLYFSATALTLLACSDDSNDTLEFDFGSALGEGFLELNIDFSQPVVYSYASDAEKDKILADVYKEIYETDDPFVKEFTVDVGVNPHDKTITVKVESLQL